MSTGAVSPEYLAADIGSRATTAAAIITAIAFVTLVLRLYTRTVLVKRLDISDWIICVAWILSMSFTIALFYDVKSGLGRHIEWFYVLPERYEVLKNQLKISLGTVILYYPMISFAKISILLQYIQVFKLTYPRVTRTCWASIWAILLQTVLAMLISAFSCSPTAFFWNKALPNGRCLNWPAIMFFNAAFNIVTDILLILLPIIPVRTLKMPTKQKIVLGCIFTLGGFGSVMSILRLHSVYVTTLDVGNDATWNQVDIAIWSTIEGNVGIMCACLATLRPFVMHVFPKILKSNTTKSTMVEDPTTPSSEMQHMAAVDDIKGEEDSVLGNSGQQHVITSEEKSTVMIGEEQKNIEGRRPTVLTLDGDDYHDYMRSPV